MKKGVIIITVIINSLFFNLYAQQNQNVAIIGFYNLENLFDTEDDPLKNDEEFLPNGANQWTDERYQTKLNTLSRVIADMGKDQGGVVVLGVSEIENRRVLEDLCATKRLSPLNFGVAHHDSPDLRGVDVAFIYRKDRFEFLGEFWYPLITENPRFITRDQYVIKGVLDKTDTMYFIVNHYPSKRGGEKRSAPYRIAAANLTRHIVDSLYSIDPMAKVIIMGDFNDGPTSKCIVDNLKTIGKTADVKPGCIFNPMWKMYKNGIGSYPYRDTWELIDQIMLTYALMTKTPNHYHYKSAEVFQQSYMVTPTGSYAGYPMRTYAGGVYQAGYSDHFPVLITLQK
ncbi:MAG: endonuclease/exonuclease/phosphatase family protein [Bacteroidales bacterium]|jgi:exonuclease III|nr:endonuclease/exonuclease/phosphatase family protein [Bacteroidales bacterium]